MKALTVQQPWAWAIMHGGKDVENRTRAWSYRGPLAIHAGTRWSERGGAIMSAFAARGLLEGMPPIGRDGYLTGALIGVVDLVDVHQAQQEGASVTAWADWCCTPWGEGHYAELHGGRWRQRTNLVHLVLENPRPLPDPIPCPGRLGLWTPPAEILDACRAHAVDVKVDDV